MPTLSFGPFFLCPKDYLKDYRINHFGICKNTSKRISEPMDIAALIILLDYLRKTFMAIMSDEHDNNKNENEQQQTQELNAVYRSNFVGG